MKYNVSFLFFRANSQFIDGVLQVLQTKSFFPEFNCSNPPYYMYSLHCIQQRANSTRKRSFTLLWRRGNRFGNRLGSRFGSRPNRLYNRDLSHVVSVGEVVIARAHVTVLPRLRDAETRRVAGGWCVVQLMLQSFRFIWETSLVEVEIQIINHHFFLAFSYESLLTADFPPVIKGAKGHKRIETVILYKWQQESNIKLVGFNSPALL